MSTEMDVGECRVPSVNPSQGPEPAGEPYDWFRRAMVLLEGGNPDAALQLLERLRRQEPTSRSVLEAYARSLFDARRYQQASEAFQSVLDLAPDDDYAHFGLGMALWRLQSFVQARDELAMACVMRPARADYARALAQVAATLRARSDAGLPLNGPVGDDAGDAA